MLIFNKKSSKFNKPQVLVLEYYTHKMNFSYKDNNDYIKEEIEDPHVTVLFILQIIDLASIIGLIYIWQYLSNTHSSERSVKARYTNG